MPPQASWQRPRVSIGAPRQSLGIASQNASWRCTYCGRANAGGSGRREDGVCCRKDGRGRPLRGGRGGRRCVGGGEARAGTGNCMRRGLLPREAAKNRHLAWPPLVELRSTFAGHGDARRGGYGGGGARRRGRRSGQAVCRIKLVRASGPTGASRAFTTYIVGVEVT